MTPLPHDKTAAMTVDQVRRRAGVPITVVRDRDAMAKDFAQTVLGHVRRANKRAKRLAIIMPVGPTGQWKQMADMAARDGVDLSRLCIIQMDEYLSDSSRRLRATDPFSFAKFVQTSFGRKATAQCRFRKSHWVVPDPGDTGAVDRAIRRWGGVDVAFAGIGLNGHLAFNEPPLATSQWDDQSFAQSSTRVVQLAETTKATNSIFGTGGDLARVPDFAVTIGMKQILGARQVHVFLDWPWQRFVWRRALLGPVSRFFPASFLQRHRNVRFTMTEEAAMVHPVVPE